MTTQNEKRWPRIPWRVIFHRLGTGCALLLLGGLAAGCTARQFRESADREAYRLIREKTPQVPNMETKFTIATNAAIPLDGLLTVTNADPALGEAGNAEMGAHVVPLDKALEIAFKTSRNYQNRKETLYLEALNLSLARHKFTPIFSGGAGTAYSGSRNVTKDVQSGVDQVVDDHRWSGSGKLGLDVLTRSGARIATDFTTDFLRLLVGDRSVATSSALASTLTQPLLRGAGYKVTMETLTQSERNLLYALRDFVRFRKDYVVQVARSYYGVLQSRDLAYTAFQSYQAFKRNADRTRALQNEGRAKLSDLSRLEQSELNSETSWITAINGYRQALDNFKITLGLPTDARLVLDDQELRKLKIIHPKITVEEGIRVALASRLDFYTVRDQFEDAARKTSVAKNGLLPDLDVVLSGSINSTPGSGLPALDLDRTRWNAGVNLTLPLDRKAERNTYRSAIIAYERAARALELAVDNIKLDIFNGVRNLEQYRRNFESSAIGVKLAQQRVQEQGVLAELARGTTEEVIAAQNDLVTAQNNLTAQLVNHTIARLTLWRDMGILFVKDNGQWEEYGDGQSQ
jgi:outer membrane protein TolC